MRLEDIHSEIKSDSVIDNAQLDTESLRIPMVHAKYYRLFTDELRLLKGLEKEYAILKKDTVHYYMGKAADAVYKARPLDFKVLRGDVDLYLNSDPELSALKGKVEIQTMKCELLENFIKTLNARNFLIKNAIDFRKFLNGS
jgi:hypothetical protein